MSIKSDPIIGIDLGTTYSVVAILEGDEPVVIPNAEGALKTPSVVTIEQGGSVVVGEIARRQAATKPGRTVQSIKRLMGHYFSELDETAQVLPYTVEQDDNDEIRIHIDDHLFRPQDISAEILKKLKADAEDYLGQSITQAIITVPAYFDDRQRSATKEAGQLAGLDVLRLVNEPTAAAMAYGLGKERGGLTAVYDFGGGTFDLTVLDISDRTFEVLVTEGDSQLGGDDIDALLVQLIVNEFFEAHGLDLTQDPPTLLRIKEAAEKAKCELSTVRQTTISLPFLAQKGTEPLHFERSLSRSEFEELIEPLVQRSIDICDRGFQGSRVKPGDIERILLVGGTTRIPLVAQLVEDFFEQAPYKGVNPDEIVAMGAAVQAGVLSGQLDEVVLLDVTPHTLGIETKDGNFSRIVERNTTIPIKMAKTFTTTEDNQEFVNIHVLQGEHDHSAANLSLGRFLLKGVEPSPAGTPRIRVSFQINADGILEITAQDMASGAEKGLTITHAHLSEEERRARDASNRRRLRAEARSRSRGRRRRELSEDSLGRRQLGIRSPSRGEMEKVPDDFEAAPVAVEGSAESKAGFAVVEERGAGAEREASPTGRHASGSHRSVMGRSDEEGKAKSPSGRSGSYIVPGVTSPLRPEEEAPERPHEPGPDSTEPDYEPAPRPAFERSVSDSEQTELLRRPGTRDSDYSGRSAAETGGTSEEAEAAEQDWSPRDLLGDLTDEDRLAASPSFGSRAASAAGPPPRVELCPEGEFGDSLQLAFSLLDADKKDQNALSAYDDVLPRLEQLASVYELDPRLRARLAKIYVFKMEPEKALQHIEAMLASPASNDQESAKIFSKMVDAFPNHTQVRRRRAEFYHDNGKFEGAVKDLEHVLTLDSSDQQTIHDLEHVYERLLETRYSAAAELRLIKLLLRQNKLDEAIDRLEHVLEDPNYRDRARKVLGFCFWQKQMYYRAFKQFKELPMDEELKDVFYRLASDLEAEGQLSRAVEVLEQVVVVDPDFRESESRLRKLRQAVQSEQSRIPGPRPYAEVGGRGITEALRGSRFVVLEELNRGSMGVVYKAKDTTLDDIVALKVLNDFLCVDPMAIERFKREARAARKLSHHRIVRINDLFEVKDKKIISMEYIEGRDLKRIMMERKRLKLAELKEYVLQIAEGLEYAHRRGVVHRDIKPANIMITKSSQEVKITDFGIAKNLQADDMTTGSRILGTPLYMAPEQIEGKSVDARTDIYALGVMMYEMASGNPPFCEGNIEYQHIHNDPPPLPATVNTHLAEIIMRALQKRKDDRFSGVQEMIDELKKLRA